MNEFELKLLNADTGEVIDDPSAVMQIIVISLDKQIRQRHEAEEKLWKYEVGFWLLAVALAIDLARWLCG